MNTKKICLPALLIAVLAIGLLVEVVSGQETKDSLLSINRTGISDSLLTIGMEGVGDSRLAINTIIIEIELTGLRVYPISCNFGLLRPGDIRATDSVFTIYNASNVTVNATISVTGDWAGTANNWAHSDECVPGVNTAGLRAIIEDGSGHTSIIVKKTAPYNNLVTNLAPGESCNFALEIYAPKEFSEYTQKVNSIIVTVSEE